MGGRGGAPRINLETAVAQAAARAETPAASGMSPEERAIRDIYQPLADRPIVGPTGNVQGTIDVVHVSRIREGLAQLGWSREKQDAEFRKLITARKVIFIPQANQKVLTQTQRDGAFPMGGEMKHLMTLKRAQ